MTPSPITAPKDFPRPIPRLRVVEPVRVPEPEPTRLAAEISDEAKRAFGDLKAAFERLAPAFGTYTTPAVQAKASDQALKVAGAAMKVWEALR
jgi:hypothetical protein